MADLEPFRFCPHCGAQVEVDRAVRLVVHPLEDFWIKCSQSALPAGTFKVTRRIPRSKARARVNSQGSDRQPAPSDC